MLAVAVDGGEEDRGVGPWRGVREGVKQVGGRSIKMGFLFLGRIRFYMYELAYQRSLLQFD